MYYRVAIICIAVLIPIRAWSAYVGQPPLLVTESNAAAQVMGSGLSGVAQPVIPLITTTPGPFPPVPSLIPQKTELLPLVLGTPTTIETDGVRAISISPAYTGAAPSQASLAVSISPNPAFQCPFIQSINQTASTTVITGQAGRFIHVCGVLLLSATAQSVTLAEGTGTTCGTGPTYWDGGSGGTLQLSSNGGYSVAGSYVNYPMQVRGDNVCVLQSSTGNVSGHLTYGVYP